MGYGMPELLPQPEAATMTPAELRDRLANSAASDGGWGYHAGQPGHLEPTCLAMAALGADVPRHEAALTKALTFLAAQSLPDGSYRLARGRPQAAWPTALVLFAKQSLNADAAGRGS